LPSVTGDKPTWLADYAAARQVGRMVQKPLAVVVGSGQEGWERLSQDGKLGKEVNRLLAANYVCVYVDSSAPSAKALADALEVAGGPAPALPPPPPPGPRRPPPRPPPPTPPPTH